MPRLAVRFAIVAVAAAAIPSTAPASSPTGFAEAIAVAAWPSSPCRSLSVEWDATLRSRGRDGEVRPDQMARCAMSLAPELLRGTPERLCDVVAHEAGHLAGADHTPNGLMMAPVGEHPACHALTRRQRAFALVRSELPMGGLTRAWRISCDRRVVRCTARAPGARTRFYGVDLDDSGAAIDRLRTGRRARG